MLSSAVNNLDLSAGTGDKTSPSLGFSPKAVLAFFNNQTAVGSAAHAHIGVGFSDSTADEFVHYFNSQDAAASSAIVRSNLNNTFLKTTVEGATTARVTATMKTLDADGFTVTTSANVTSAKFPFLALGGVDLTNSAAGEINLPNSTSNFSITGLAFQPDIIFLSVVLLATTGTAQNNNSFCFGVAKSSTKQWCSAIKGQNSQATMNTSRAFYTGRCLVVLQSTGDTAVDEVGFVSMNSDGATFSHPVNSSGGYTIHYLALKGGQWDVGTFDQPTSNGNYKITIPAGSNFEPNVALFSSASYETVDTPTPTARMMIGAATVTPVTNVIQQQCIWMGDRDNVPDAKADSRYAQDKCIMLYSEVGGGAPTVLAEANFTEFNLDGATVNFTSTDATVRKIGYVFGGNNGGSGFKLNNYQHFDVGNGMSTTEKIR